MERLIQRLVALRLTRFGCGAMDEIRSVLGILETIQEGIEQEYRIAGLLDDAIKSLEQNDLKSAIAALTYALE